MKRIFALIIAIAVFITPITPTVKASNDNQLEKTITLSQTEIINDDYFAVGDTVEIFGTVNGDVYAAAGQVIIDGTINGDLLVAGGTVLISGTITDDVRAVGGTINITGSVGRNITFAAGDVTFTNGANIAGNAVGAAGNTIISTPIGGDVKIASGNMTLSNTIGGNVESAIDQMRLTSQANIGGDLIYWSENDASIDETASVSGTITRKQNIAHSVETSPSNTFDGGLLFYQFLTVITFGLILIYLFPQAVSSARDQLAKNPWISLAYGFAVLILTPIVALFVMITIIGIPVSLALFIIYFTSMYLAKYISMVCAGEWIYQKVNGKSKSLMKSFLIGLAIYFVLKLSPITSFLGGLAFLLFGLGAIAISTKGYIVSQRK